MADRALHEVFDQALDAMLAGGVATGFDADIESLLHVAGDLRQMPSESFEFRLGKELQKGGAMPSTAATRGPQGYRTVTPFLMVTEGEKLVEFLKSTFGAEEKSRGAAGHGLRVDLRIGDSMLMIGSWPEMKGREKTSAFHVFVPDCDAAYERAVAAGATPLGEPADRPYGERSGFVRDFAGNTWYIASRFPATAVTPGTPSLMPYLHPAKARDYIAFLERAFGAEELFAAEHGGKVMHAAVRIGNAVIEMGEGENLHASRLFLDVEDCDAWYRRAIDAGATSVQPPADQFYGLRTAVVRDAIGNEWEPATLIRQSS